MLEGLSRLLTKVYWITLARSLERTVKNLKIEVIVDLAYHFSKLQWEILGFNLWTLLIYHLEGIQDHYEVERTTKILRRCLD